MIGVIAGFVGGYLVGAFAFALLRAADEPDQQLPTLGKGTWLVAVDQHGELVRCEPHVCFEDSFRRLEEVMRKDDL